MKHVSLELIKKVRNITGIGICKCKNALLKTNGNIEEAIYELRKNNKISSREKINSTSTSGSIFIIHDSKRTKVVMVEVHCETDFVSSNILFKEYVRTLALCVLEHRIENLTQLEKYDNNIKKIFTEDLLYLSNKFGENVYIKNILYKDNYSGFFGVYTHVTSNVSKIGVIVVVSISTDIIADEIAMQIAATNPKYIKFTDIPAEILLKERKLFQTKITPTFKNFDKFLDEAVYNSLKESVLLEQNFILNQKIKMNVYLNENNVEIKDFVRFELGL